MVADVHSASNALRAEWKRDAALPLAERGGTHSQEAQHSDSRTLVAAAERQPESAAAPLTRGPGLSSPSPPPATPSAREQKSAPASKCEHARQSVSVRGRRRLKRMRVDEWEDEEDE